jgi:hypothetical protein
MTKPVWEIVTQLTPDDRTERMKVPGGWLVCRISGIHIPKSYAEWFVTDPDHQWIIND